MSGPLPNATDPSGIRPSHAPAQGSLQGQPASSSILPGLSSHSLGDAAKKVTAEANHVQNADLMRQAHLPNTGHFLDSKHGAGNPHHVAVSSNPQVQDVASSILSLSPVPRGVSTLNWQNQTADSEAQKFINFLNSLDGTNFNNEKGRKFLATLDFSKPGLRNEIRRLLSTFGAGGQGLPGHLDEHTMDAITDFRNLAMRQLEAVEAAEREAVEAAEQSTPSLGPSPSSALSPPGGSSGTISVLDFHPFVMRRMEQLFPEKLQDQIKQMMKQAKREASSSGYDIRGIFYRLINGSEFTPLQKQEITETFNRGIAAQVSSDRLSKDPTFGLHAVVYGEMVAYLEILPDRSVINDIIGFMNEAVKSAQQGSVDIREAFANLMRSYQELNEESKAAILMHFDKIMDLRIKQDKDFSEQLAEPPVRPSTATKEKQAMSAPPPLPDRAQSASQGRAPSTAAQVWGGATNQAPAAPPPLATGSSASSRARGGPPSGNVTHFNKRVGRNMEEFLGNNHPLTLIVSNLMAAAQKEATRKGKDIRTIFSLLIKWDPQIHSSQKEKIIDHFKLFIAQQEFSRWLRANAGSLGLTQENVQAIEATMTASIDQPNIQNFMHPTEFFRRQAKGPSVYGSGRKVIRDFLQGNNIDDVVEQMVNKFDQEFRQFRFDLSPRPRSSRRNVRPPASAAPSASRRPAPPVARRGGGPIAAKGRAAGGVDLSRVSNEVIKEIANQFWSCGLGPALGFSGFSAQQEQVEKLLVTVILEVNVRNGRGTAVGIQKELGDQYIRAFQEYAKDPNTFQRFGFSNNQQDNLNNLLNSSAVNMIAALTKASNPNA